MVREPHIDGRLTMKDYYELPVCVQNMIRHAEKRKEDINCGHRLSKELEERLNKLKNAHIAK